MRKARTRPLTLDVLTEIHLSALFPSKEDKARKSSFLKFHAPRAFASPVASQTGGSKGFVTRDGALRTSAWEVTLRAWPFFIIGAVVSIEVVESLLHEPDKDKDNQTQKRELTK